MKKLLPLFFMFFAVGCVHSPAGQGMGISQQEVESRLNLAEMYLVEAEPRMALEQLRVVEKETGDNPMLFFLLGVTYELLGNLDKSVDAYQRAVNLAPHFGDAWNNLGQIRQARGEIEAAKHAYEKALGLEEYMTPEFAAYNMAALLAEQGRFDQSLAYSSLGLERNRRYIPLYQQRADILRSTGRLEEAAEVLEKGIANRPDSQALKLMLAEELVRLDREMEAIRLFTLISEQNPDSDEARTALHYLEVLR